MKIIYEFKDFIREYKLFALAMAFVMGAATNDLIKSFVNNIVMPVLNPILNGAGGWEEAVLTIGPIKLAWGSFLSALIYFLLIALIIFMIAKHILKEEKVSKK